MSVQPGGSPDDLVEVQRDDNGDVVYTRTLADGSKVVYDYKRPFILELELTWRCNLKCFHCYVDAAENAFCDELTLKEIERVCDDAAAIGMSELSLTGGEVLLREDFTEVLSIGHDKGLGLRFVTNGSLLDEQWLRKIGRFPVKLVTVSLDAVDSSIHNGIRGCDCHRATLEAIERLLDNGFKVSIITAFSKDNIEDFDALLEFCARRRIDWQVQLTSIKGRCPSDKVLTPRQYYNLGLKVARAISDGQPMSIIPMDDLATFSRFHPLDILSSTWQCGCSGGKLNLFVRADGSVTPCSAIAFEPFIVGNIRETSLAELCATEACRDCLAKWLDVDSLEGTCAECPHRRRCRGGCPEMLWTMCGRSRENRYCYWKIEESDILDDLEGIW